jgi:hypothetical protein
MIALLISRLSRSFTCWLNNLAKKVKFDNGEICILYA